MGANAWIEVEPYVGSIEATLESLHARLMVPETLSQLLPDSDELTQRCAFMLEMLAFLPPEFDSPENRSLLERSMDEIRATGVPATREGVSAVMAETLGTGTALDISGMRNTNEDGDYFAITVADAMAEELFGSEKPTLEALSNWDAWKFDGRAIYCALAYEGDDPIHVVFAGLTGD